jgi:hypothetical protein
MSLFSQEEQRLYTGLKSYASFMARTVEGTNTRFSTVLIVFRLTPMRSAS